MGEIAADVGRALEALAPFMPLFVYLGYLSGYYVGRARRLGEACSLRFERLNCELETAIAEVEAELARLRGGREV